MAYKYIEDKTKALRFLDSGTDALDLGQASILLKTVYSFDMWFRLEGNIPQEVTLMQLQAGFSLKIKKQQIKDPETKKQEFAYVLAYEQDSKLTFMPHRKFRPDKWYHLGLVYKQNPVAESEEPDAKQKERKDHLAQIYVNGFQVASIPTQGELRIKEPLKIGESFNGLISLVTVWLEDKTSLFTSQDRFKIPQKEDSGLMNSWSFDSTGKNRVLNHNNTQSSDRIARTEWAEDVKHPKGGKEKKLSRGRKRKLVIAKIKRDKERLSRAKEVGREPDLTPLVPGQASHAFKEVLHYNAQQAAAKHKEASKVVLDAQEKASETLQNAHQEAAAILQNSKFDNIYHIYGGKLRSVDAQGQIRNLSAADLPKGLDTGYMLEVHPKPRSYFYLGKKHNEHIEDGWVDLNDSFFQVDKTVTFAAWMKFKRASWIDLGTPKDSIRIFIEATRTSIKIDIWMRYSHDMRYYPYEAEIPFSGEISNWNHWAFSFPPDRGEVNIYLNGNLYTQSSNYGGNRAKNKWLLLATPING